MSNATKTRKPVKPASGTYRWVRPLDAFGVGVLSINGKAYTVETLEGGYRLTNQLGAKVYDIDVTQEPWACDCPDYTYNRAEATDPETRVCKHCRALRAALKAIGK
jgi:hypothetical protein